MTSPHATSSMPPAPPAPSAPTAQARSGARRRKATREQIVQAMERLIVAGTDYDALTMADIAKEASVSRATLYLHFADKRDIIAELASRIVAQRFDIGAEIVADPRMDRTEMRAVVSNMMRRWLEDAALLRAIVRLAEQDPAAHEIWVAAVHEVGDMGAALMRQRWGNGPGDFADARTLGRVLAWMFERSARQLAVDPQAQEQTIDAVAEVVWRVIDYRP